MWIPQQSSDAWSFRAVWAQPVVAPAAQVSALHALGPDYQSTFSTLETNAALDQVPAAAVLVTEGKDSLEARLLLSYNAQVMLLKPLALGLHWCRSTSRVRLTMMTCFSSWLGAFCLFSGAVAVPSCLLAFTLIRTERSLL